jgi:hypothetical protein
MMPLECLHRLRVSASSLLRSPLALSLSLRSRRSSHWSAGPPRGAECRSRPTRATNDRRQRITRDTQQNGRTHRRHQAHETHQATSDRPQIKIEPSCHASTESCISSERDVLTPIY